MSKPEIRKDYFKDDYVIIAPNRARRPLETKVAAAVLEDNKICHFCPDNFHGETITYQDNGYNNEWEIVAVINKFAALNLNNNSAYGQTEVIIETRRHGMDINDFSVEHIVRVLNAYINRYTALRSMDGIKHVVIFKNEGGKAGASIAHTHSQVYALPILPAKIENEAKAYAKYRLEHDNCPYCDIIKLEAERPRVIWQDDNVFVLSPYASDSPYGAWLMPKRHIRLISELTHSEKESFATAMRLVLGTLDKYGIAYNYFVENAVNDEDYHMHIKLAPRPNVWAGLELGTGVIINPIPPEYAARIYRDHVAIQNEPRF